MNTFNGYLIAREETKQQEIFSNLFSKMNKKSIWLRENLFDPFAISLNQPAVLTYTSSSLKLTWNRVRAPLYVFKKLKVTEIFFKKSENMLIKLITYSLLAICINLEDKSGTPCLNPSMLDTIRDNNNRLMFIGRCCVQCFQNNTVEVRRRSIEWLTHSLT